MKKYILLSLFNLFVIPSYCQLQNPSFENWDAGDPLYWATSDFYNPGSAIQSNDAHGGIYALNLSVVINSNGVAIAPYAINNFPLTTMPQVLTFWMKGNLAGNNNISASFNLAEIDTSTNVLAYGDQTFTSVANVYQYKFVNILPLSGPSLLGIGSVYFAINAPVGSNLDVNSSILIDDLYLGVDNTGTADFESSAQVIEKVYPNPAGERAFLVFNQLKYGNVCLKVYDLTGNLVLDVLNENLQEGKYKIEMETSALKQGVYLCHLYIEDTQYFSKLIK